jgi:ketosteroid isomerase-like protein
MSQENVETVRRAVDAVNRRDVATLDSLWSEEGEVNSRLGASEGHVFRGRQGIRDYFAWLDEAFEEFRSEVEEIIDAGEDRVVALLRGSVRGKASGVPLDDQPFAIVITFEGERIARADGYWSRADALEAAGLSE